MSLDPNAIRRLAFIKYLYALGVQQSNAAEPLSGASILTFHDAVELFLYLAAEICNVAQPKMEFMGYFTCLAKHLGISVLPQQASMHRLNIARVALKHQGILPHKLEIEGFRATITNFFSENTPLLFSQKFEGISLSDVVRPDEARLSLKAAEELLAKSQLGDALKHTCVAFDQMMVDYEDRKRDRFGRSIFTFGPRIPTPSSAQLGSDSLSEFLRATRDSIGMMQEALKMMAFGLDYSQYLKFRMCTPGIQKTMDGKYHFHEHHGATLAQNKDEVQFCIDFVVLSALKLQESDFDIPKYAPTLPPAI